MLVVETDDVFKNLSNYLKKSRFIRSVKGVKFCVNGTEFVYIPPPHFIPYTYTKKHNFKVNLEKLIIQKPITSPPVEDRETMIDRAVRILQDIYENNKKYVEFDITTVEGLKNFIVFKRLLEFFRFKFKLTIASISYTDTIAKFYINDEQYSKLKSLILIFENLD